MGDKLDVRSRQRNNYEAREKCISSANKSKQARTKNEKKSFQKWRANHLLHDEQYWVMSRANPLTKKLRARSLKQEFNATEWGCLLVFPLKMMILCFLGTYLHFLKKLLRNDWIWDFLLCVHNLLVSTCAEYLCLSLKDVNKITFLFLK